MTDAGVDRRRLRGQRSRRAILERAVDIASLDGLDGLSFGRLADDLGVSKSGVQTLFRTKEQLQLATVEFAAEMFADTVVRPALDKPEGRDRLDALIENWLIYASVPVFAGGCFWGANLPRFDSSPGPVRGALARGRNDWTTLLARQVGQIQDEGAIPDRDAHAAAFQIDAVLNAINVQLQLGDADGVAIGRRALAQLAQAGGASRASGDVR